MAKTRPINKVKKNTVEFTPEDSQRGKLLQFKTAAQMEKEEMVDILIDLLSNNQIGDVILVMNINNTEVGVYTNNTTDKIKMMGMLEYAKHCL